MKTSLFFLSFLLFLSSCDKEASPQFQAEVDERFSMLQRDIIALPTGTPVSFYWTKENVNSFDFVTSSPNTEIKFEKPYLVVNNTKFHVYYWESTQNRFDNSKKQISGSEIRFNREPQ